MSKKNRLPKVDLHASFEQLVWEASLAAMSVLTSEIRAEKAADRMYRVHIKDLVECADVAHALGTRMAMRHICWAGNVDLKEWNEDLDGISRALAGVCVPDSAPESKAVSGVPQ